MDWRHKANCKDVDPEIFWPLNDSNPTAAELKAASEVCFGCRVKTDCLIWAKDTGEQGLWADTTTAERRAMAARQAA